VSHVSPTEKEPVEWAYRPGPRLLPLASGLIVVGLLAFLHGIFLVLLGLLVLVLLGLAWRDAERARETLQSIHVTREVPVVVGRGLPFLHVIHLARAGTGRVCGEVRDVLPSVCEPNWLAHSFVLESPAFGTEPMDAPRESKAPKLPNGSLPATCRLETKCRIPIRGSHSFGPIWIRVEGPWGLMEAQRPFPLTSNMKVLPETFASREQLQKDLGAQLILLDKAARSREVGSGTEFVSLFPFRQGDDPRRIDWRATARHGYPIVRRFQVERHRDVLILIDSGRLMGAMTDRGSKLDCAVDSALNLARVVLHSGDRCGIGVFDSSLRGFLAPLAGGKALGSLVECVYGLETSWRETDFTRMFAELQHRQSKRCLLIVLSDLGDHETSRSHCAALARLSRRHLVLFAALRTPLLRRVIHREPTSIIEGARQAVAMHLLRDRGRALNALKHGGIHVLDVEPQQLTLPLINQFIELRQRNLL
jgi:uncharacterized protein (DUF58 family)